MWKENEVVSLLVTTVVTTMPSTIVVRKLMRGCILRGVDLDSSRHWLDFSLLSLLSDTQVL